MTSIPDGPLGALLLVAALGCGSPPPVADSGAPIDEPACSGESVALGLDETPHHWDQSVGEALGPLTGGFVGELALADGTVAAARLVLEPAAGEPAWVREDPVSEDVPEECSSIAFVPLTGTLAVDGLLGATALDLSRVGVRPDRVGRGEVRVVEPALEGSAAELAGAGVLLCVGLSGDGRPTDWAGWTVELELCTSDAPTWTSVDEEWHRLELGEGLLRGE